MNMWAHTGLWRDAGAIGLCFLRLFVLVCTTEFTVSLLRSPPIIWHKLARSVDPMMDI